MATFRDKHAKKSSFWRKDNVVVTENGSFGEIQMRKCDVAVVSLFIQVPTCDPIIY